jgi:hypothetical protein
MIVGSFSNWWMKILHYWLILASTRKYINPLQKKNILQQLVTSP